MTGVPPARQCTMPACTNPAVNPTAPGGLCAEHDPDTDTTAPLDDAGGTANKESASTPDTYVESVNQFPAVLRDKFDRLVDAKYPTGDVQVEQADASSLPFADNSAEFALTSPPYMHMLDYSWNNWLRLWWLGADRSSEQESLSQTSSVSNFRDFMSGVVAELDRVLTPDARAVIVIGDVRKHRSGGTKIVYPARMIAAEAVDVGFEVEQVIEDDYNVDKRYYTQLNNIRWDEEEEDDKQELIDRILVLRKGSPDPPQNVTCPWQE